MYLHDLFEPVASEVVTQPFIDHVCTVYRMNHFDDHGIEHWLRVLYNGRLIAEAVQANTKVVVLFALLHDCQRISEHVDPEHGVRAASYAETLHGVWFELGDNEMWQLSTALSLHSSGQTFHHPTVQACWDADRLDLARVGIKPDPQQLCHNFSKRPDVIDAAVQRSALSSGWSVAGAA